MHSRVAVGSATSLVNLVDPFSESRISSLPLRGRSSSPIVIAASGDTQHAAHQWDRETRPLRLDELKSAHRVPSTLAKKAAVGSTGERNGPRQYSSWGAVSEGLAR